MTKAQASLHQIAAKVKVFQKYIKVQVQGHKVKTYSTM